MKRITVRVEDYIYDKIVLVAKDNKTSINKVVVAMFEEYINQPREINYLKQLDDRLEDINKYLEKLSKRSWLHFKLSQQHFANFGYLSNADIKEDKCLNEILNSKDNFNE